MDAFVVVYRLIGLGLIAYWVVTLVVTARKPADWQPAGAERFPFRITRNLWLVAGVLGVIAGIGVVAFSFVLYPT